MRKIITKLGAIINRKRGVGGDTKRLPSLVKAMRILAPKAVMREVIASSHDRRQWGLLAAAWVGVSEREFISAAARELRMPYQDHVAVPDLTIFGAKGRSILTELRKIGASVVLEGSDIVGFIATDPAEVRGLELFDGKQQISMAPWTEVAKALDMAERLIAEAEANVDRAEGLRRREVCNRVIKLLIDEAAQHGAVGLEILSGEGRNRYQFVTAEGKIAVGSIHPEALSDLLLYLNSVAAADARGDGLKLEGIGPVLVRSLGSSANLRLAWGRVTTERSREEEEQIKAIEWRAPEVISVPEEIIEHADVVAQQPSVEAKRSEEANLLALKVVDDCYGSDLPQQTKPQPIPVLVVDDNPMFCHIVERLLERDNFKVSFVHNGRDAYELLLGLVSFLPRVILCDIHMPGMNGCEFIRLLKEDPRLSSIPIIVLTSDDGIESEVSALRIGADSLISKSKDPRVLIAHVLRLAKVAEGGERGGETQRQEAA
jgi:CheY-like chemotaxis protein